MRKDKIFKSFWISFEDRLPPMNDDPVLLYNPKTKRPMLSISSVTKVQQEQKRERLISDEALGKPGMDITGYHATHWMKLYRPEE